MMKRIFALWIALSLLCSMALTAYAHDVPQERNDCSIELIVRYNGTDVDGGTLTAVRVGYVAEDDGNYFFCREMDNVRLDDIADPAAPAAMEEFYEQNKNDFEFFTQTVTVRDGKGSFTGLSTGLYLIIQEEAAEGYSKLSPVLVSVPYMEDGKYQYHVTASLKSELDREPEPTEPPPTEPGDPGLPQTGQLNWPIPLMVVAGLVFFVAGWILRFGKKRESYEK